MQFANPIWLWGLTGLLIPIGIHLLSRKEGKTIKIGSVRHLEDTNTKQFRSLRLNEMLLLTLRCLLITTLVFFLSGFYFKNTLNKGEKWLLIEKGLEHDQEFSSLMDSLDHNGFQIKSLAAGYPDLQDSIETTGKINYWSLVEDLKTKPIDQAVVLSYNYVKGFQGKRITLPDHIHWISKNSEPVEFPLQAIRLSNDSTFLRLGKSDASETRFISKHILIAPSQNYFTNDNADSILVEPHDTISIAVVSDSTFEYDKRMMLTALNVIKEISPNTFNLEAIYTDTYSDKKRNCVIWLSNEPPPSSQDHNIIRYQKTEHHIATKLFLPNMKHEDHSLWVLTKRLNEGIALQENLTVQLARILLPKEKYKAIARKFDKRVLPEKMMWDTNASFNPELKANATIAPSDKYILILFLIILLTERLIAFKRHQ